MKRKFLPGVTLIMSIMLAACGPKSAPGLNVTDVENTAAASALTLFAMTQSAIPTATPVLPTPVPSTAVATLVPLPTAALGTPIIAPITNPNASPTPDCYQPPPAELSGTTAHIRLVNKSDGPVNLSMGMYAPNEQGECFTFAFFVSKKGSVDITVLSGCYWIAGYQNGPEPSTPRADYICFDDSTEGRGVSINNNSIGFD